MALLSLLSIHTLSLSPSLLLLGTAPASNGYWFVIQYPLSLPRSLRRPVSHGAPGRVLPPSVPPYSY